MTRKDYETVLILKDVLEWWIAQMQNDSCDDMGKLLDDMTDKARAALTKANEV